MGSLLHGLVLVSVLLVRLLVPNVGYERCYCDSHDYPKLAVDSQPHILLHSSTVHDPYIVILVLSGTYLLY